MSMIAYFTIQLVVLAAIAIAYAAFDVFNKRNVPNSFAYIGVLVGLAVTLFYNNGSYAYFSIVTALVVGVLGYVVYRAGLWGAGDYFELATISLILPVQPVPILTGTFQFGLPFVLSVFIATGLAAIWAVPIYYLLFVKRKWTYRPTMRHVMKSLWLMVVYMAIFTVVYFYFGLSTGRLTLMLLIVIPSAITLLFEEEITARMIERVYPHALDEGDMIAFNMMSGAEKKYFSKYRGFGRLATKELIERLKQERRKLPVYKNAAPLAAFILIGTVVALLFGNFVLLIL